MSTQEEPRIKRIDRVVKAILDSWTLVPEAYRCAKLANPNHEIKAAFSGEVIGTFIFVCIIYFVTIITPATVLGSLVFQLAKALGWI